MPTASAPARPQNKMYAVSGKTQGIKVLGYLVWFSVPDEPVKLKKLRTEWAIAALDTDVLPEEPKPTHVFKRAVASQKGRVKLNDGTIIETDVRPFGENEEECIYQVTRVTRNERKQEVDYPKAMRVRYIKANEGLIFEALGGVDKQDLLPIQEAIETYFDEEGKRIEGRKVRAIVRKYLSETTDEQRGVKGLGGTNMRGKAGGLYFVPEQFKAELDGLAECLRALYPSVEHGLNYLPMADGRGEREMVRAQHVARAKDEIEEAIDDVRKLLRDDRERGVRGTVKDHHWAVLRTLKARAQDYKTILRDEDEDLALALEVAEKQMQKLAA